MPPIRKKNSDVRPREHLTPAEAEKLRQAAARIGRYGARDALMVRMTYIHGLRASETVGLLWSDVDFEARNLFVRRLKGGIPSTHPLAADEIRSLKKLDKHRQGFIFKSERDTPLSASGFGKIVRRAGKAAGFEFVVHPHMLRHACGYKLGNDGKDTRSLQAYLGHANIQNTVRYTAMSPNRFRGFWVD
jgi:type 1 fimbriae regulatory protein FimB/type 1 fimbriae regulatory protein FimE